MTLKLKTPCSTPGCVYRTEIAPTGLSVSITLPDGLDLSSLKPEDLREVESELHRHAEYLAWTTIRQAQVRRGVYELAPYLRELPPNPYATLQDHNAQEIIRRAASRMAAKSPDLATDTPARPEVSSEGVRDEARDLLRRALELLRAMDRGSPGRLETDIATYLSALSSGNGLGGGDE